MSIFVVALLPAATTASPALAGPSSTVERVSTAMAMAGVSPTADRAKVTADGSVSIDNLRPAVSLRAGTQTVRAEVQDAAAAGSSTGNGTRVYGDVARNTDFAITTPGPGTVQILAIMHRSSASNTQRYKLDLPAGAALTPVGGGYLITGSGGTVIGTVNEPWAKDAKGRHLPTRYEIDGTTLVQRTETAGAEYPIVADPRITIGLGVYLNMWGYELRATAIAYLAAGGAGLAVACATASRLPSPLNIIASIACTYVGSNAVKYLFRKAVDIYNSNQISDGTCYQIKLGNTGDRWKRVSASNC
ncbi:hypothetical protein [Lentzea sp. NPDC051838]|uniref:hypothetical protein n=1 Tax=Lentzea sp. NPDC051838 TaxID=3154849 RepID=UPI00343EA5D6